MGAEALETVTPVHFYAETHHNDHILNESNHGETSVCASPSVSHHHHLHQQSTPSSSVHGVSSTALTVGGGTSDKSHMTYSDSRQVPSITQYVGISYFISLAVIAVVGCAAFLMYRRAPFVR
jgi:hypothetical protein